jgi:hypothetical protein
MFLKEVIVMLIANRNRGKKSEAGLLLGRPHEICFLGV